MSGREIAKSAFGDGYGDLLEDGVHLGLYVAHSGVNLSQLPLCLRPIVGSLLKQPPLAVN
jgi:hypothetical protein